MNRNITKSIVIMAGVYARQFNCQIKLSSNGIAKTDGKTIYIPKPKPEYLDLTWGYTAHEAGHVRFTDMTWFVKTSVNPTLQWMVNVIEDTRIEKLMQQSFPGVKKYFISLSTKVLTYGSFEAGEAAHLLSDYIFYYVRGKLTNYPIWDEEVIKLEQHLYRSAGMFFMLGLQEKLDRTSAINSTEEAHALAVEILEFIATPPQEDSQDDSQSDSQDDSQDGSQSDSQDGSQSDSQDGSQSDSQDGSQSDSQDDSQSDSQDDSQSDSQDGIQSDSQDDSQSDSQDGSQSDSQDDSQSDSQDGIQSDSQDDSQSDRLQKITNDFLQANAEDFKEADLGRVLECELNDKSNQEAFTEEEQCALDVTYGDQALSDDFSGFEALAGHTTNSLRNGLIKLMETQTRTQRVTSRKGRKLAKNKLHRLCVGNTRVFKREFQHRNDISSDVVVLADASGSMGGNITDVKVATYALLDCLSKIEGANTSAFVFLDNQVNTIQSPFEQFSQKVKSKIASIRSFGGTPTASAIWSAIQALLVMRSKRKVVIVITDGEPNSPYATKQMVEQLKAGDVTVVCLGVGVSPDAIPQLTYVFGDSWVEVSSFDKLPQELLNIAQQVI